MLSFPKVSHTFFFFFFLAPIVAPKDPDSQSVALKGDVEEEDGKRRIKSKPRKYGLKATGPQRVSVGEDSATRFSDLSKIVLLISGQAHDGI